MKKADFKKIIKPLVKECINEVLVEQGVLSNIITEVVRGLQPLQSGSPQKKPEHASQLQLEQLDMHKRELEEQREIMLRERKRKLLDAAGFESNIFEGVDPLLKGGNANAETSATQGPLSGVDPRDPGVDITGIMALGGRNWKKMAGN